MVVDRTGFIWISTYDGLNRFDGYEFKIFRYDQDDSTSIPTTRINKIFYDQGEHLWLHTDDNIVPFNIENGQTIRKNIVRSTRFQAICLATRDNVWVYNMDNELMLINKHNFELVQKSKRNKFISKNENIIGAFFNGLNIYLVSQEGCVYIYNSASDTWKKTKPSLYENAVKYNSIAFNHKSTVYIGSMENDMLQYDIHRDLFTTSSVHEHGEMLVGVNDLYYDTASKDLLISTYGQGAFVYNETNQKLTHFKKGNDDLSLASNYCLTVIKDENNNLFIGYDGKGLDVLDANLKKFVPLKKEDARDEYNLKFVRRIVEDQNGILWFATSSSGLVEYNKRTDAYTFHNKGLLEPIADNFILELVLIENQIWLGLSSGDILLFDINKKKIIETIQLNEVHAEYDGKTIWSMAHHPEEHIVWVGTEKNGIYSIDIDTRTVTSYFEPNRKLFSDNKINCLYMDKQRQLIVGTNKGVLLYEPKHQLFKQVYPRKGISIDTRHAVRCIYKDIKNRYWLGTDGAGIAILDETFKLIKTISSKDKLNNNVIYGILPENSYSLWASSNVGLSNINWSKDNFTKNTPFLIYNYESTSGLQSNEFNTNSYIKLADGSLGFGGINGVNIFHGHEIKTSNRAPNVIITDFAVFHKKLNEHKLTPYINNVNLSFNQNSFSLRFNTVGLTVTDKIHYQYKLKGYEPDWIYADRRTYVSYTNLPPGDYEFQVKASNYDGYWSKEYTSLKIHIASPIYMRWWFILGLISLATFIIWSYVRNKSLERTARENLKLEYTKEIAEVEMKALRAQINPHFLFNALNSINNFILKNENKKARKYLVKFSDLVRRILNNSTGPYISLREEIDTINLYVQIESMRFDNQFNFNIELEENLHIGDVSIPSLLLQPYIENAIWHGLLHKVGQKNINISISKKDEQNINITIEDNGIGRKAARVLSSKEPRRKSYGMQLGANRLKLMNSENQSKGDVRVIDLYNDNQEACGTRIEITLPILNPKNNKKTT